MQAHPIALPVSDIAVLDYSGYETVHHVNGNTAIGAGDIFDGLIQIDRIRSLQGTVDLSSQLSVAEVTGTFQFHINASTPCHRRHISNLLRACSAFS